MEIPATVFTGLCLSAAGCTTTATDAAGDAKVERERAALKGTWVVVSAERDGEALAEDQINDVRLTYDGTGRATVKKGDTLVFDGTFRIDPAKTPKAADGTQAAAGGTAGKPVFSIYELAGDTLKLCSAEPAGKYRPTEFATKPGSGHFLRVFKRERE